MRPVAEYEEIVNSGYTLVAEILDRMYVEDGLIEAFEAGDEEAIERSVTVQSLKQLLHDDDPARWFGGTWNKPKGHVYFTDRDGKADPAMVTKKSTVPLRNVEVGSSQLVFSSYGRTDDKGYYFINNSYGSWFGNVRIRLIFENEKCHLNGYGKWWEYITNAYEYVGSGIHTSKLSPYDIDVSTNKRANDLANVIDAVEDYYTYCTEMGIAKPRQLRFWLFSNDEPAAVTIYGREGAIRDIWTALGGFGFFGGPVVSICTMIGMNTLANWFPDVLVNTGLNMDYFNIQMIWHEMGHASHFGVCGSAYLYKEYFAMLPSLPDYPQDSDIVDLVESWGYFNESYITNWKHARLLGKKIENATLDDRDFNDRAYSLCFKELLVHFNDKLEIRDIFEAIRDTTSISSFIDKLAQNEHLSDSEKEEVRQIFEKRAWL